MSLFDAGRNGNSENPSENINGASEAPSPPLTPSRPGAASDSQSPPYRLSEAQAASILGAALDYAERGWRVVPGDRETKHPPMKRWQKKATTNAATIEAWWQGRWPNANVCVQMGPTTGIIDIETDSDEAENVKLLEVFGGEAPAVTATFASGSGRGKHRLFKYRDDLPPKANMKFGKIDFKLGYDDLGSQSVFPPSINDEGKEYKWLPGLHPDDVGIADLPDTVFAFLWNLEGGGAGDVGRPVKKPSEHWERIAAGVSEGSRHVDVTSIAGKLLGAMHSLSNKEVVELQRLALHGINNNNTPPLAKDEVDKIFDDILGKESAKRLQGERDAGVPDMRLVIIESEPPMFELYADEFAKAEGGCLRLTGDQLISASSVKLAALNQAQVGLDGNFSKAWSGKTYPRLVAAADRRPGDPAENRTAIVAQCILQKLEGARSAGDSDTISSSGHPTRLSDGSVTFTVAWLVGELVFDPAKPTRGEIMLVIDRVGGENARFQVKGTRTRCHKLSRAAVEHLDKIAWPERPALHKKS